MYYSYNCPYCSKQFYVYNENKEEAAKKLYEGIDRHETEFGEDKKDFNIHEYDPETETDMIYDAMQESSDAPSGGYSLD